MTQTHRSASSFAGANRMPSQNNCRNSLRRGDASRTMTEKESARRLEMKIDRAAGNSLRRNCTHGPQIAFDPRQNRRRAGLEFCAGNLLVHAHVAARQFRDQLAPARRAAPCRHRDRNARETTAAKTPCRNNPAPRRRQSAGHRNRAANSAMSPEYGFHRSKLGRRRRRCRTHIWCRPAQGRVCRNVLPAREQLQRRLLDAGE